MTDFFRASDDVTLHVDDTGGSGLPVIFQHGLCGDAKQPAEVFPPNKNFRRVTVECRGHGLSEVGATSKLSIQRFANDIAEMVQSRGLGPVVIGGISMGAAIAIHLAVARPDLVRGLIIARPAWGVGKPLANMHPNAELGRLLAKYPVEEARWRFNGSPTAKHLFRTGPDNLTSLRSFFTREPIAVTASLLQRISKDRPNVTWKQLRALAIPTLIIGHEQDYVHPMVIAQQLADAIPRAKLSVITPKAVDKQRYVSDFKFVMQDFLEGFWNDVSLDRHATE